MTRHVSTQRTAPVTAGTAALLVVAAALAVSAAPLAAQGGGAPLAGATAVEERELRPGVRYIRLEAPRSTRGDEWAGALLEIDLGRARLGVELAAGQVLGQETVSSMVRRREAIAGVNGGFSVSNDPYTLVHGDPDGFVAIDGRVVSGPVAGRPAIGFCRAAPRVRFLRPEVRLATSPALPGPVGLNRERGDEDVVVYLPEWGRSTLTTPGGVEVVVRGGRVVDIRFAGSTSIPDDGFVISASGLEAPDLVQSFRRGTRVAFEVEVLDGPGGTPVDLTGCDYTSAGPIIVRGGRAVSDFDPAAYRESFRRERHPRTAVGVSRDGRTAWLFVIDGRHPEVSVGATLEELAELMIGFGAWTAYNLDGGGSTTMALRGTGVVNRPSDGVERRRSDAVLVFSR